MTSKRIPKAPKNIRPEASKLWRQVHHDFDIDPEATQILTVAVISLSRFLDIRETIDREGSTYETPTGQLKKHPGLEVEKIARQGFFISNEATKIRLWRRSDPTIGSATE